MARELDMPPRPAGCEALWAAFVEMSQGRASNGFGYCAISWQDVHAWQLVRGVSLTGWEIETIQLLDRVALSALNKKTPKA